ncbi:hypothetical protein [Amycolatopsis orientalis]|uniref:hypothetical protein n=1 Tax=Amycolatopsis orientalis TaxID=31958 RepID=UPI0006856A11|nr:hypothetical protein [Amycolatopsis orientalis]
MVDSVYDWLSEHHLGVAATLSHADELIGQISDLLFDYQTQTEGVVGLHEVRADAVSRTVVDHVAPIPRKVPLLVADVLVALRAALEHALFAEAEYLDGAPLEEKAARLVDMPASETPEKFEQWTKNRASNGPVSLRAGGELHRRVADLQPFHHADPRLHPLARLVLHTNHAKHRTPAITAVRLAAMYRDDQLPRSLQELSPRPEEPLRVGDVIAETSLGAQVAVTLFPTVGINRPGTGRWPVLMHELDEISRWVRVHAVPRLLTGTEQADPPLPARYKISVGHQDERRAIAAGSTTTAVVRHLQRLSAASARVDMVDVLHQLEDSPGREQISAWLSQLTDEDVLTKVSSLKANHDYDPLVMRQNAEILIGLRDDARVFVCGEKSNDAGKTPP